MIGGLSALFVGLAAVFGVMLGGTCGLVGSALVGLLDANLLILTFDGAGLGATLAVVLGSTALVGGASGGALGLLGSALHRIESVEGSLLPQLFLTAVGAIVGALLGYHVLHGATAGLCASASCIWDARYCVDKGTQAQRRCGMPEAQVGARCAAWPACKGVVCPPGLGGYCVATGGAPTGGSSLRGYRKICAA